MGSSRLPSHLAVGIPKKSLLFQFIWQLMGPGVYYSTMGRAAGPANPRLVVCAEGIHALKDIVSLVYSADYDVVCLDKEVLRILKEDLVMQWHQMLDLFLEILKVLDRN